MSPVFDVARRILVVDVDDGVVNRSSEHEFGDGGRVEELSRLGVDVLICSAVSWPVEAMLWVAGIEVISDICGPVDDIIDAHLIGYHDLARFRSPGYSDRKHGGRAPCTGDRRVKGKPTPRQPRGVVVKT